MIRKSSTSTQTRERLLDAAEHLILAKGFAAASVGEICEAAGLTKGSFFHHFGSKEEMGMEAADRFILSLRRRMQEAPFWEEDDALRRLYGYIDFIVEISHEAVLREGCLLGTLTQEVWSTHPGIRSRCEQHFAEWADTLRVELDKAVAQYPPREAVDTQSLAEHFIAVLEGALILDKAKRDGKRLEEHLGHFKRYLASIFEPGT